MIQRLAAEQRDWRLLYAVRSRARAYLDVLLQRYPDRFSLHVDDEPAAPPIWRDSCGPRRRTRSCIAAVRRQCWTRSNPRRRTGSRPRSISERFKGGGDAAAGGFTVIAAASGGSHFVAEGSTILDTLLDAGLDIPHSCADGICGTCATRVIEGIPDHRDTLLSAEGARRTRNADLRFRLQGSRLVLDL